MRDMILKETVPNKRDGEDRLITEIDNLFKRLSIDNIYFDYFLRKTITINQGKNIFYKLIKIFFFCVNYG